MDVQRAGEALAGELIWTDESADRIRRVFSIANNYRDSHALPMRKIRHELSGLLQRERIKGVTVARLKRMNCSSSGLRSRSRASPSTWSSDGGRPAKDGESCITMRRTLPPWTSSLFQRSVSTCAMPSSSSGTPAETSPGSMSQPIALHRHSGQAYRISPALPEWHCRTADRINPA